MRFDLLTIFPNIFNSYFQESIIKRAQEKKKVRIAVHNIRDYSKDKHKMVDDRPYGGGPGMVLKIEPVFEALKKAVGKEKLFSRFQKNKKTLQKNTRIILTDPDGKLLDQNTAKRLSRYEHIVILCGHYEGIDARVEKLVDEKISIGNYVITGGELAAMTMVDAVTRLIPGVLGNPESLADIAHYHYETGGKSHFDYPHYTRPEVFSPDGKLKWKVPEVLLSGDHKKIEEWRRKKICLSSNQSF